MCTLPQAYYSRTFLASKLELGLEKDKSRKDLHQLSSTTSPHHTISALRSCQTRLSFALQSPTNPATNGRYRPTADCHAHLPRIQHHFMRTKGLLDDGKEDNIPIRTPITKLASTTHGAFADSGAMSGRAWLFDWVSGKLVLDMVVGRCSSSLSFPSV